jgi:hypothetical protein
MLEDRPRYHVIDLVDMRIEMGAHYKGAERDTYTGQCWCDERVGQDVDRCPFCGMPIVWRGSRVWKRMYGPPEQAIQRLDVYPPDDEAGKVLCEAVGTAGFRTKTDLQDWNRGIKKLGRKRIIGIVNYVLSKEHTSRYGAMAHALNMVRKYAREAPRRVVRKEREVKVERIDRPLTKEEWKRLEMG